MTCPLHEGLRTPKVVYKNNGGMLFYFLIKQERMAFSETENLLINTDGHAQNSRTLKIW